MTTTNETPTTATPTTTNDGGAAPAQDVKPDTASGESAQNQQQAEAAKQSPEGAKAPEDGAAKPDAAKPADAAEGEGDKPQGAPEKYEFSAPEGVTLDPAVVGSLSEVAKDLNLSQESAQKLVDKMAPAIAAQQAESARALTEQWREQATADKEYGGAKLAENMALAQKAMDAFATPEFKALLNQTGLGNHPEVVRVLYRAGKAISDDKVLTSDKALTPNQSIAERMYPNHNPGA